MDYIGDISNADFLVLKEFALKSENILEFGVGASTQVIANYNKGAFTTLDTSEHWINLTKKNITYLGIKEDTTFLLYNNFKPIGTYDFVFNDGVDHLRNEFGLKIWEYIKVGGVLAYHDTRRQGDVNNVIQVISKHFNEISDVQFNVNSSNITLIYKKELQPYYDWNIAEQRVMNMPKDYSVPLYYRNTLTQIANRNKCDKGTEYFEKHGYTEEYAKYIPEKGKNILIEIGIWHGDSLKMWNEYNPDLFIHGIDISNNVFNYIKESDRIKIYIGNQSDTSFLQMVIHKINGSPDFIIDDGSHNKEDILNSFKYLYPHLKNGGIYFIEDLHVLSSQIDNIIKIVNESSPTDIKLLCNNKLLMIKK